MHGLFRHAPTLCNCRSLGAFDEQDLYDNNIPVDNTTPIYLLNLIWKLGLGLGLDSELHYFSIFRGE